MIFISLKFDARKFFLHSFLLCTVKKLFYVHLSYLVVFLQLVHSPLQVIGPVHEPLVSLLEHWDHLDLGLQLAALQAQSLRKEEVNESSLTQPLPTVIL